MLATHLLTPFVTTVIIAETLLLVGALILMWHIRPRSDDHSMTVRTRELMPARHQPDTTRDQGLEPTAATDDPAMLIAADKRHGRVKGDRHRRVV